MPTDLEAGLTLRVDGVVWREVDDELVVLEVDTGMYLNLNGSATVLWGALTTVATGSGLVSLLIERYGIPAEQAEADVQSFLGMLKEHSLLQLVG